MSEKLKSGIRSWLNITPAQPKTFNIQETLDFETNALKNRLWYLGDADELTQFYQQMDGVQNRTKFWAARSTASMEMRKIHTGLPSIIADTLTGIIMTGLDSITVPDKRLDDWKAINKEDSFKGILEQAVSECLYLGDGAFKISYDKKISEYPIIEWYPADQIDIKRIRGRLDSVVFRTTYEHERREYVLYETYGYGYIDYDLRRKDGNVSVDISTVPELSGLSRTQFDDDICMAFPMMIFRSPRYKGRGKSIFDAKTDDFDALDEAWSQWMQAMRDGRSMKYIPESYIPRNPKTGELIAPNPFDNSYYKVDGSAAEGVENKIEVIQPSIPHDSYCATYINALDLCLQGLISPSTLGIDVKKLDNADAQREKEKTTLYTRGKIIDAIQDTIPSLLDTMFKTLDLLRGSTPEDSDVTIDFGEYANPSFESQIETIGKAKTQSIMSNEAVVDELYGDTKTDEWKKEEVRRLNARDGIEEMEEPSVNMDGLQIGGGEL